MRRLIKTLEYGTTPNSHDVLKAIALAAMVIDHIGYYLLPDETWLRVVGRLAFPIFLFLVGYSQRYRFDTWVLLGGLAVLASAAVNGQPLFPLNILFSIVLWRWVMGALEKRPHILQDTTMLWVAMLVFYLPFMFLVEYGTIGLMFAVLGWHVRNGRDDRSMRLAWLFTLFFWVGIQSVNFGFDRWQVSAMMLESVLLVIALMQFRQRDFPLPPKHSQPSPTLLEWPVILLARNSLLFYVLHVIALHIIAKMLWPELHSEMFLWIRMA